MSETTYLSIRIDRDLKEEADQIFSAFGMNLTTAITVFVRQAVRQRKIPFEIALNSGVSMRDAIEATECIWNNSIKNGTDKITSEEIETEILAA